MVRSLQIAALTALLAAAPVLAQAQIAAPNEEEGRVASTPCPMVAQTVRLSADVYRRGGRTPPGVAPMDSFATFGLVGQMAGYIEGMQLSMPLDQPHAGDLPYDVLFNHVVPYCDAHPEESFQNAVFATFGIQ